MNSRRQFLKQASALAALPLIGCAVPSSLDGYALLGAWRNQSGQQGAGRILPQLTHQTSLPTRGHHIEVINTDEAWLFARRPSEYMRRVNWRMGEVLHTYQYDGSRAGFGHGIMRPDGRLLTTDQNLDTDQGLLTVRDGRTGEVIQEFDSGGIGPHELLLMPDGQNVAIANGGILTRPEMGRMKLNVANMQPNLTIIDAYTGQIKHTAQLPDSRMSIRHLAMLPQGGLAIALQYEYNPSEVNQKDVAVAAMWHPNSGLVALRAPEKHEFAAQGYAASVVSDGQTYCAVSCPKAHQVMVWRSDGRWLITLPVPLVYGLAHVGRTLIASGENGDIRYFDTHSWQEKLDLRQQFGVVWDNHLKVTHV
ncbi:hypothetical protein GCM10009007_16000 [Formosimonas limnophila]|uniref:Tat (Twin-arginine translocation) pathway signal sequence n=1 Tax=Formosimonas limnophila TaxID=1384487 RepID=A0A8J3CI74_9BURK|nr:DUF1513 domain-containing protein [Formosimonas limnophila]GHA75617.1 hypothetical protein GCM10009007_16000 [Formosimonas limnophila]